MGQLNHDMLILAVDEFDDLTERFDLGILPDAGVFRRAVSMLTSRSSIALTASKLTFARLP